MSNSDDNTVLARFRSDISSRTPIPDSSIGAIEFDALSVTVMFDHAHSFWHVVFLSAKILFDHICDNHLLADLQEEEGGPTLKLITWEVLAGADEHVDKTAMNLGHAT